MLVSKLPKRPHDPFRNHCFPHACPKSDKVNSLDMGQAIISGEATYNNSSNDSNYNNNASKCIAHNVSTEAETEAI